MKLLEQVNIVARRMRLPDATIDVYSQINSAVFIVFGGASRRVDKAEGIVHGGCRVVFE